jgi:AbrB family looped-hinge helix DNA binding protein
MTITMDSAGRLVVPKAIREQAGLRPDMPLEISCRDGHIEIAPAPRKVKIVSKGRLRIAVAVGPSEPLTDRLVEKTKRMIQNRET